MCQGYKHFFTPLSPTGAVSFLWIVQVCMWRNIGVYAARRLPAS